MKKIESVENTGSACRKMYMTPLGEAIDIEISFNVLEGSNGKGESDNFIGEGWL